MLPMIEKELEEAQTQYSILRERLSFQQGWIAAMKYLSEKVKNGEETRDSDTAPACGN